MNDPRYRNPARPVNPQAFPRGPRGNPGEPAPEFDEDFDARPPRDWRGPGGLPARRPLRGPAEDGLPPGRRPLREREDVGPGPQRRPSRDMGYADPAVERRPPRGPRDPGMPPRRSRPPDAERAGRGMGSRAGREGWAGPPAGPDWEPGMRPQRPRPPGRAPARRKARAARRLHWRYRYGALVGIMLFAGVAGTCLGLSGIGGHNFNLALLIGAIPALLASMGCAGVYVYF